MPMTAELGGQFWHRDVVPGLRRDVAMAAGAHVRLGGLVGLHPTHVDGAEAAVPELRHQASSAQTTTATVITIAATTIT
jgi:hypothetical protein